MARGIGTPETASLSTRNRLLALVPLFFGALCTLGWLGLLVGLFAGMNIEETAIGLTVALLVLVTLAGLSTLCVRCTGTIIAIISALLFAGVWTYLRVAFDPTMPDVMLLTLTAVFFITPLVTGVTALTVGVRARS